jgi:hypothetical protein
MSAAIEQLILRKLAAGPCWARSFHTAKPVVDRLVARGLVRRVAPEGKRQKNMLALVEVGDAD